MGIFEKLFTVSVEEGTSSHRPVVAALEGAGIVFSDEALATLVLAGAAEDRRPLDVGIFDIFRVRVGDLVAGGATHRQVAEAAARFGFRPCTARMALKVLGHPAVSLKSSTGGGFLLASPPLFPHTGSLLLYPELSKSAPYKLIWRVGESNPEWNGLNWSVDTEYLLAMPASR